MSTDDRDQERIEHHRRHLYEALHSASRDYDQAILTLAAGTLALSVTFAHSVAPAPTPESRFFLTLAWLLLAVAIVAMVFSFQTSQAALMHQLTHIDDEIQSEPWTVVATRLLNALAGLGLVAGLGLLGVYALANL